MDINKGRHFSKEVIAIAVRWYVAYALSYRDIEELMDERGLKVDHSALLRWVERYAPEYEKRFRAKNKVPNGSSWRMDETYIKVKGQWYYLYRCVDKEGNTVDFYLSKHRDTKAVKAFIKKAIFFNGIPEKVNIDKSGANKAGLEATNARLDERKQIFTRQCKYLNNMVEQDHRGIKRIVNPMRGFGSVKSAKATKTGIEFWRMLKKSQGANLNSEKPWQQFYEIAA